MRTALPSALSPDDNRQAKQSQERLTGSLNAADRTRFFPPYRNPKEGRLLGIRHHFMSKYQPYLYSQLLESINPEREPLLKQQEERQCFERQMKEHYGITPEDEYARNRVFLDLQNLLGQALRVTQQTEGGAAALVRFDAVAEPDAYYTKTYG